MVIVISVHMISTDIIPTLERPKCDDHKSNLYRYHAFHVDIYWQILIISLHFDSFRSFWWSVSILMVEFLDNQWMFKMRHQCNCDKRSSQIKACPCPIRKLKSYNSGKVSTWMVITCIIHYNQMHYLHACWCHQMLQESNSGILSIGDTFHIINVKRQFSWNVWWLNIWYD